MGAGMLGEGMQASRQIKAQRENQKIGTGLKAKGKHRQNLMVKDLPPELQKIAMGRMRVMGKNSGPGGPRSTSFVPKSVLDELECLLALFRIMHYFLQEQQQF